MKHTVITLGVTVFGIVALAAPVSAQISDTGPGSNNTITSSNYTECTSTAVNEMYISNQTSQSSSSGSATVSGNTSGGNATSGNSSNSSSTTTAVTATNNSGCLPGAVTTPETNGNGGSGGGQTLGATTTAALVGGQGAAGMTIASLPETGGTSPAQTALAVSSLLSGAVIVAYLGRLVVSRYIN